MSPAVVYRRVQHAAHYAYNHPAVGHDLEQWVFASARNARPAGVPADAEYHSGFCDGNGVQHWVYVRTAPLTGTCAYCDARRGAR